jgi:cell division septation protein DedD
MNKPEYGFINIGKILVQYYRFFRGKTFLNELHFFFIIKHKPSVIPATKVQTIYFVSIFINERINKAYLFSLRKCFIFAPMLRITTHIERLLAVHDCVIIPGVGGFVLQTVSAIYRKDGHTFLPMRKDIVFNEALQHNDGLLAGSYMQVYRADYPKAQEMAGEDIAELKSALLRDGKIRLGDIGSLSLGKEGQTIFRPAEAAFVHTDYYGLPSFSFPVLPVIREKDIPTPRREDILYIPVKKRFIRGIVASAAAMAAFILVSLPVNADQPVYTAAIIPAELLRPQAPPPLEPEPAGIKETAGEETAAQPVAVTVSAPATAGKTYYVVIASFPSPDNAREYLSGVKRAEYAGAGIVVQDGRYRVYARKYTDRREAETFLSTLRENTKYRDTWLFIPAGRSFAHLD